MSPGSQNRTGMTIKESIKSRRSKHSNWRKYYIIQINDNYSLFIYPSPSISTIIFNSTNSK